MMSLHKERKQKGAFLVLFAVLLPVFLLAILVLMVIMHERMLKVVSVNHCV